MVISILGDEESVISAITVGATGYLLKDAFPTDIAATVRDLVAGAFLPAITFKQKPERDDDSEKSHRAPAL